jgi:hypothetical protein
VPERVTTIVEGESLVNDGVALVLYRIAVGAALSGGFSLVDLARVREDLESGRASGVAGTPSFFLDGEPYTGFYDAESLSEVLAAHLRAVRSGPSR